MSCPFSFLITGGSSGLGLNLALAALRSGHKVIATARNATKAKQASPEVEHLGGSWLTLDVTSPDTESIVKSAVEEHGVNVLVNSAGYALLGAVEDMRYVCEISKRQYWTRGPRYLKNIATNDTLQRRRNACADGYQLFRMSAHHQRGSTSFS
jgi:NAD(P)-dependent dehydrogenase (short-subunit alcohol dehydrogenase family)